MTFSASPNILTGSDREACQNLLEQLLEYGILIVPGGELESWLQNIGANGHGSKWLIEVFERMGETPDDPRYLQPTSGDVWDFIGLARQWLTSSNRKGLPD
jgi:hypothetical protein